MKDRIKIDGVDYERVHGQTKIHFILDNSGSMAAIQDSTIDSFNEYVTALKRDKNVYRMSLTTFADSIRKTSLKPLSAFKLTRENYTADGMSTSLYDAVCKTLKKADKSGKNLVVILTDGLENSSREYNREDMKKLIKDLTKDGNWTFVYLGANQDSFQNAVHYGIPVNNTSNFNATPAGIGVASRNLADSTVNLAFSSSLATGAFMTEKQQKMNEDVK